MVASGSLLASLSLISGSVVAGGFFLLLEVQRPLRRLERALARVGLEERPEPVPQEAGEVQRLSQRFNAMLARLQRSEEERATMLAGIAHDLKSPITRLRLRLAVEGNSPQAEADLDALERITGQFLLFAGGGQSEERVLLPLHGLLGEVLARYDQQPVELALEEFQARVQPVALGRAIANLVDNALSYGEPPVVVRLQRDGDWLVIAIEDQGQGIDPALRDQALMPFRRWMPPGAAAATAALAWPSPHGWWKSMAGALSCATRLRGLQRLPPAASAELTQTRARSTLNSRASINPVDAVPPWPIPGLPWSATAAVELPALLREPSERQLRHEGLLYQCQMLNPNQGRSPEVCWNDHWR